MAMEIFINQTPSYVQYPFVSQQYGRRSKFAPVSHTFTAGVAKSFCCSLEKKTILLKVAFPLEEEQRK
jgi:hypothetical protein